MVLFVVQVCPNVWGNSRQSLSVRKAPNRSCEHSAQTPKAADYLSKLKSSICDLLLNFRRRKHTASCEVVVACWLHSSFPPSPIT